MTLRTGSVGLLAVGLLALVLAVSGCSSGAGAAVDPASAVAATTAADGTQQVTLTVGNSMSFDPAAISVHAGQPVTLTLHNTGGMAHDFSLNEGVSQPVKITANGGEDTSGTFTVDKPGKYAFDCSMPGHAMGGMRGVVVAQ